METNKEKNLDSTTEESRVGFLFANALDWIYDHACKEDLYSALSGYIEMSDEEIIEYGFDIDDIKKNRAVY